MKDNILIVGLGSIGSRHLNNLLTLGFDCISIVTRLGKVKEGFENFDFYTSITSACSNKVIHTIIIATPTSQHIPDLIEALDNNIDHIYLEKPISNSLEELSHIREVLSKRKKINLVVGYDLRFDPGLVLIKQYINEKKIGKIVGFIAEVGQYLPDWRPGIDYRESMSASKQKGGGVMLDLVHEFDYVNWLVGPVKNIVGLNGKVSDLEIDTEDISVNLIETNTGALGSIHLDYLQPELSRNFKIIGDKGLVVWNYQHSIVRFMSHQDREWKEYSYSHYERNDRFLDVMKAFMESRSGKNKDKKLVNFNDAITSIKMVELSKRSCNHKRLEEL